MYGRRNPFFSSSELYLGMVSETGKTIFMLVAYTNDGLNLFAYIREVLPECPLLVMVRGPGRGFW